MCVCGGGESGGYTPTCNIQKKSQAQHTCTPIYTHLHTAPTTHHTQPTTQSATTLRHRHTLPRGYEQLARAHQPTSTHPHASTQQREGVHKVLAYLQPSPGTAAKHPRLQNKKKTHAYKVLRHKPAESMGMWPKRYVCRTSLHRLQVRIESGQGRVVVVGALTDGAVGEHLSGH